MGEEVELRGGEVILAVGDIGLTEVKVALRGGNAMLTAVFGLMVKVY